MRTRRSSSVGLTYCLALFAISAGLRLFTELKNVHATHLAFINGGILARSPIPQALWTRFVHRTQRRSSKLDSPRANRARESLYNLRITLPLNTKANHLRPKSLDLSAAKRFNGNSHPTVPAQLNCPAVPASY